MKQISLPCGLSKDGKLIYIDEAKNGLECECFCPSCKQPLIAKNGGKKREHHFAHLNVAECEHGYQSALHYMAKDLFMEMEYLTFIKNNLSVRYKIDSVELEHKVSDIIPDILVTCDGKQFIVEIYVTHAVDDDKKQKIKNLQISAIEVDISRFKHEMFDKETLKQELCKTENFSWIYDADEDLIAQKKDIISQFGAKLPIQIGNAIGCPILIQQPNQFARFVTLDFCLCCPNCVYQRGNNFVSCGVILPTPLNFETRAKLSANIFVNQHIVLFASEFENYKKQFTKNLEKAMQMQYRIFLNIGRSLYVEPTAHIGTQNSHKNYRQKNHYYHHHQNLHPLLHKKI